jgi:predicted PurR-regulated permease PerM
MKPQRIEISYKTIIFTILSILGLLLLWNIRDIILLVFVCFILMEALNPTINKLESLKIPRALAILMVYVVIISIVSLSIAGVVPLLVEQTTGLARTLPNTISNLKIFGTSAIDFSSQFKLLETLPSEIAKTVLSIFSNLFSGFIIMVITFYLLIERRNFARHSLHFFGHDFKDKIMKILEMLENRLGNWVNGELILMTLIGLFSYVGYLVLGLNYAVPLALIAGILEIVPNIGPIIAAVLAALVGLTVSPLTALLAIIWGIIIQQIENNFITPRVMKAAVGLNPIITILTITIGAKLAGIGGALLAVPVFLTIETVITVLTKKD